MGKALRWGVLGAARIARDAVCPAIHLAEGAELVALATRNPARAAPFLARYPGLAVHADYAALLAEPGIDAVYIPLPNHMHVPWTLRALEAGKHVLCEKPIALEAGEIDGLIAARDASGRMAAEAFMVLHHPQWLRARDLIAEGAIGRLRHVSGSFCYTGLPADDIRTRAEFGGGGLRDIGVYPAITTRFVTGAEPVRLMSRIERHGEVDGAAHVWADFPGFTLSFHVATDLHWRQEMVFHGEEGILRLPAPFRPDQAVGARLEWQRADGTEVHEIFAGADQYRLMIENFGRSVRAGASFACPLEFSRGNQAMIDAIFAGELA